MDPMHAQFTKRYNIPLDHLDFKYISACTDVKELENIYKVLLSGDEGRYPELETHCEAKLSSLAPNSRVLRKDQPPLRPGNLDQSEWASIAADLDSWATSVSEPGVEKQQQRLADDADLPPVRAANATISLTQINPPPRPATSAPASAAATSAKRPMPRSYSEWSRLEKELDLQQDDDSVGEVVKRKPQQPAPAKQPQPQVARKNHAQSLPSRLRVDGLSAEERLRLAEQEKAKGNEAFRSGDFEEAAVYYTRSASASPLPAAYNNRAFAYLKLQKYTACVKDCSRVLKSEPDNAKALLRRATAYHRVHRSADARADLEQLLGLEPDNSAAKTLLAEVDALLAKRSKPAAGAKRMVIEEVGSSDEEDGADEGEPNGLQVNGSSESSKPQETTQKVPEPLKDTKQQKGPEPQKDTKQQKGPEPQKDTKQQKGPEPQKDTKQQKGPEPQKDTKQQKGPEPLKDDTKQQKGPVPLKDTKPEKCPETPRDTKQQKGPDPPKDTEFESLKEAGNQLFKAGNYARAMELYNRCTQLRPQDPVPYTNRAVCCIKLDRPDDAVYECNMALEADPNNMKAIFRRGVARKMLGLHRESLLDLNLAKSFDPLNRQIGREIAEVEAAMGASGGGRGGGRRILVQEVEDDDDEEQENADVEVAVPVIRDVGGVVTEHFANANASLADKVATVVDQPTTVAEKTAVVDDKAAAVAIKAATVTDKPDTIADKPETIADKTATVADKPETIAEKPTAVADKPETVASKSGTVADKPATVADPPPLANFAAPAAVADKPATVPGKSTTVADKPAAVASKPSTAVDPPPLANFPAPAADLPRLRPDCSPFEFTQAWTSAARGSRPGLAQGAAHADLLSSVDPGRLPRLLSNKLDGPLLQQIVAAVRHGLLGRDARMAARVLLSLPAADRFQVVTMFLGGGEKSELTATLEQLESLGAASSDEIRQLKSAYQL